MLLTALYTLNFTKLVCIKAWEVYLSPIALLIKALLNGRTARLLRRVLPFYLYLLGEHEPRGDADRVGDRFAQDSAKELFELTAHL